MHKFTALLLAALLGLGSIAGCGSEEKQTATEFCADKGGVRPNSEEPDGDALCEDGTEYEAESESSSKKKKSKKKRK